MSKKKKKQDLIVSLPSMDEAKRRASLRSDAINYQPVISQQLKDYARDRKYYIHTYGCQANVRDGEIMAGMLEEIGFSSTDNYKEASIIIINTCAVRENAEDKVFGEVGNLKGIKDKTADVIAVCGCMVEEPVITQKIMKTYPHVNLIFGTHEVPYLVEYIDKLLFSYCARVISVKSQGGEVVENLPSIRTNSYKAFVNIMHGCNKFCTYCIVPYTRGRERSRLSKDILQECQELINSGCKEITLLGQNVNAYGKDLKEELTFAQLLEAVAKLGIKRLRFTTSHPWDFTSDIIDVIAEYDNIMKYIHLPFQSGNDEILKLMGRRYTAASYKKIIDEMKAKIPNLSLSTDIIVGFPNETYEQFKDTLEMVDYVKYDSAFTFIYSPRPGTPAASMEDNVSLEEKHKRFNELVKTCEKYITESASKMIGKIYPVLVDGPSKNNPEMFSGYTESSKLVHFKCHDSSLIGEIVNVKIVESHTYSMIGELVNG